MKILYFSSTGNCLYVAKAIGGTLLSIPHEMKKENRQYEDDEIGIIFPVYGTCVPPIVENFLKDSNFNCKYLFAIATYGSYAGAITTNLNEIMAGKKKQFDYIEKLRMIENYIPMYDMKKEKDKGEKLQIDLKLSVILNDISYHNKMIKSDSWIDRFVTKAHQKKYAFNIGTGITDKVIVNKECKGCRICEKVCPMNNIKIVNDKPEFGNQCMSCLACVQNCPSIALHLSNEKSGERYRNENIELKELI